MDAAGGRRGVVYTKNQSRLDRNNPRAAAKQRWERRRCLAAQAAGPEDGDMKILLIEDDPETAEHVCDALRAQGHDVDESRAGPDGLARARLGQHAALIVDRMLPGLDGLSLVKQLRAEGSQTPVLFLTTMSGIDDRVAGLNSGGDDYLAKPFALAELLARVNAIARRRRAPAAGVLQGRRPGNGSDPPHAFNAAAAPSNCSPRNSSCWNICCAMPAGWSPATCCWKMSGTCISIRAPIGASRSTNSAESWRSSVPATLITRSMRVPGTKSATLLAPSPR